MNISWIASKEEVPEILSLKAQHRQLIQTKLAEIRRVNQAIHRDLHPANG